MATYKPSALFEHFRGKIGNSVFTANRAGNNLRTYVVPSNPQTAKQVSIRNIFTQIAANWFNMSANERALWTAFANAGYLPLQRKPGTLGYTGRQAYSALAVTCQYANDFITLNDFTNTTNVDIAGDDLSGESLTIPVCPSTPPSLWAPSVNFEIGGFPSVLQDFSILQEVIGGPAYVVTLTLEFDDITNKAGVIQFLNGGRGVGFAVYLSNALKAEGQSVVSPYQSKYLVTPTFGEGTSAGLGSGTDVSFNLTVDLNNFSFITGWYYTTLVIFDDSGQQYPLMSKYINWTQP